MAITAAGGRDPALVVPIIATDVYSKALKKFKTKGIAAAAAVASGMRKAGTVATASMRGISTAAGAMAKSVAKSFLVIAAAIIFTNKQADEFEETLISIGRVSSEPIESVRSRMLKLPPILGNLTELTKGYYQVISAGVTEPVKAIQTLIQASKVARISQVEQGEVVKGLTKIMAGYKGEVKDVSQASDILFTIEKLGQTSVGELIPVIGGLAKSSADLSIKTHEMGAALAQVTQFAGGTEEAATQYRAVLTALLKPSELFKDAMKKAEIGSVTLSIKQQGLLKTLQQVKEASGGTDQSFRSLFTNVRAASGAAAIAAGDFKGFEDRIKGMEEGTGAAAKAWDDWSASGKAATGRLIANLKNFGTKLGELTAGRMTRFKNSFSDFIEDEGSQFIKFLSVLPVVTSKAFQTMGALFDRFIDDSDFRKEFATSAVEGYKEIEKNFAELMVSLARILAKTSSLIWVPLKINFEETWESLLLINSISTDKLKLKWKEVGLTVMEALNFVPGADFDNRIARRLVTIQNSYAGILEKQQRLDDILSGKSLDDRFSKEVREQLSGIGAEFTNVSTAASGMASGIKTTFSSLTNSPELLAFKEFMADILTPGTGDDGPTGAEISASIRSNVINLANFRIKAAQDEAARIEAIRDKQLAEEKQAQVFRISGAKFTASAIVNTLDALNTMADGKHRSMFEALKIARTAQAIINTYTMATAAGAETPGPYWVRAAAVAAAITLGFAQVAAIQSTSFGSSSAGQSAGTTAIPLTDTTPTPAPTSATDQAAAPQNITIIIRDMFGEGDIDKIIETVIVPGINDASDRDINIEVKQVA